MTCWAIIPVKPLGAGKSRLAAVLGVEQRAALNKHLFGCVLNEYVALQTQINTFSEFAIRKAKSQDVHRWPRRLGRHLLERC